MHIKMSPLQRLMASFNKVRATAFADIDTPADTSIIDIGPVGETEGNAAFDFPPMLLLTHTIIALGFAHLAKELFSPQLVLLWALAAIAAALLPLPANWCRQRIAPSSTAARLRVHEFCTVMLGLVWASFPALFFDAASNDVKILAVAITFAVSGIGSLALARVQSSAVLFCALIAGSLSLASVKIGGEAGLTLGAFSLLYSVVIAAMILHAHEMARRRSAAEVEVIKQREIISLLLNDFDKGASNWLWEIDSGGRLTYVSQRLCEAIGKSSKELCGKSLAQVVSASPDDHGWPQLSAAVGARLAIDGYRLLIRFGARETWWRITAKPMFDASGAFAGYRGAAHNITGDHQTETQLIEAKEAAEKSNATKSQFLAVLSHELRTPLNAIVGFAELLASNQSEDLSSTKRADHLNIIIESSRHLQVMINDILDATRIERGTMQLVEQAADAGEMVEVAAKMCRDAAEKADVTIIARIVEGIELKGDITRIKQVLINLITNAVKFSPPGGLVQVSFERTESGGLAIAVRDDGAGIHQEDLKRIFEPFTQAEEGTSRRFGGMGLGLSIARKIALLHGGNVTMESEYGVGSTARFILPAWRISRFHGHPNTAASAA